jgi:hypothetical protein
MIVPGFSLSRAAGIAAEMASGGGRQKIIETPPCSTELAAIHLNPTIDTGASYFSDADLFGRGFSTVA